MPLFRVTYTTFDLLTCTSFTFEEEVDCTLEELERTTVSLEDCEESSEWGALDTNCCDGDIDVTTGTGTGTVGIGDDDTEYVIRFTEFSLETCEEVRVFCQYMDWCQFLQVVTCCGCTTVPRFWTFDWGGASANATFPDAVLDAIVTAENRVVMFDTVDSAVNCVWKTPETHVCNRTTLAESRDFTLTCTPSGGFSSMRLSSPFFTDLIQNLCGGAAVYQSITSFIPDSTTCLSDKEMIRSSAECDCQLYLNLESVG